MIDDNSTRHVLRSLKATHIQYKSMRVPYLRRHECQHGCINLSNQGSTRLYLAEFGPSKIACDCGMFNRLVSR